MTDLERARLCRALTDRIRSREGPWWTDTGPTPAAIRHREGSPMAPSARALLGTAWAIWTSSDEGPTVGEVVRVLDRGNLRAVAELLAVLADGDAAGERWGRRGSGGAIALGFQ